jgi:hypothetical protein
MNFIYMFILSGVIGSVLMDVLPAAGPIYVFADYPDNAPLVTSGFIHTMALNARLNAIPSMHTIWALLLFWSSRGCGSRARVLTFVFLGLTLMATLDLGEHYLVDLVVGVPTAVTMEAIFYPQRHWFSWARGGIAALNLAIVMAWLFLLRWQMLLSLSAPACWALLAVTVLAALHLESKIEVRVGETEGSATRAISWAGDW